MTAKLFQVIDLDRVLFDTEKFANALTDELHRTKPVLAEKLRASFEAAYAKEETFFLLRVLREMMGDQFEIFVKKVVDAHGGGGAFLLPGASERLSFADTITKARPSAGILTYGDEIDQRMKLRIAGLSDVPTLLSPTPNKTDVLRSWQRSDGEFQLPEEFGGQIVARLTLEDDKLRAFDTTPDGVVGIWINEVSTAEAPQHIARVHGLFESIDYLKTI